MYGVVQTAGVIMPNQKTQMTRSKRPNYQKRTHFIQILLASAAVFFVTTQGVYDSQIQAFKQATSGSNELDPTKKLADFIDNEIRIPPPDIIPNQWEGLIGEYGPDDNVLHILEHKGQLYTLIKETSIYPLREISNKVFTFSEKSLYQGEELAFERNAEGLAYQLTLTDTVFKRRPIGTKKGETFRIVPLRPIDELRERSLTAHPPREDGEFQRPNLVDLSKLDPNIKLDIRYATTNNFMGEVFYQQPLAFMQRPAAEALLRAHRSLKNLGYGLLIHDAYRPWHVTKMFFDATPEKQKIFVANPANGSRHNRGCAVDLTLYDLKTGDAVPMVGGYDEFSERSYPNYPGGTSRQRWHRELLRDAMETEGFTVNEVEWWHFDYRDWRNYQILNLTFKELQTITADER